MKVLLLGGTSFFGKDIARLFYEAGHNVTLFSRGNQKPSDLPPHAHIKGDRLNAQDLRGAADSGPWDVVVDNIAYDAEAVHLATEIFRGIRRYILTSTVSVYRYVQARYPQPLKENSVDFNSTPAAEDLNDVHWKYARGKLEAERALMTQDRVRWTILRPPVVYGPHDITDRGFWYLSRLIEGGPLLLADSGSASFRMVYSVDCAKSFVAAAEREKAMGGIYNIAQSEIITLKSFIEDSAKALGVTPNTLSAPLETLGELAGPYASMINLVPDISNVVADLDYRTTPWSEVLETTAHWFRDHWKGDRAKLMETRARELELAQTLRAAPRP